MKIIVKIMEPFWKLFLNMWISYNIPWYMFMWIKFDILWLYLFLFIFNVNMIELCLFFNFGLYNGKVIFFLHKITYRWTDASSWINDLKRWRHKIKIDVAKNWQHFFCKNYLHRVNKLTSICLVQVWPTPLSELREFRTW